MNDLQYAINFYRDLARKTSTGDLASFYEQVAVWLEDYKRIKDSAVSQAEQNMKCSCCGSHDLYEAILDIDGGGDLRIKDSGDSDFPLNASMRAARCCRVCGNVMPYISQ